MVKARCVPGILRRADTDQRGEERVEVAMPPDVQAPGRPKADPPTFPM